MQENANKSRKIPENPGKSRENSNKFREIQINSGKFK
jgi:hypothetical protein